MNYHPTSGMHGLKIGSPLMSFFFSAHKTYNNTAPNNKHHSLSNLHPISLEKEKINYRPLKERRQGLQ
jgi:hypothetical protein